MSPAGMPTFGLLPGGSVTILPQAPSANAAATTRTPNQRSMSTSRPLDAIVRIAAPATVTSLALPALSAVLLAATFPKINAAWLGPIALAPLFWLWRRSSWKSALLSGWLAGTLFFLLTMAWIGTSLGEYVGTLAPLAVVLFAAIEGLFFGVAGAACARLAVTRTALWPLGCAALWTLLELARGNGPVGVPFGLLGDAQAATPFIAIAAYLGVYGISFALALISAATADLCADATRRSGAAWIVGTLALTGVSWWLWPARVHAAAPTMRVAVVQGNVSQDVKWSPQFFWSEFGRYERGTLAAAAGDPALVVWPETVVTTFLNESPAVRDRLSQLARRTGSALLIGTDSRSGKHLANQMWGYGRNGNVEAIYTKRNLVPFAEYLPLEGLLGAIPLFDPVSRFSAGSAAVVFHDAPLPYSALICYESAFPRDAWDMLRAGAQVLVIATDDAWFGTSAGPYQHAELAQLRAVEEGAYVVRAAATGISGIIAPDGTWRMRIPLGVERTESGMVGAPTWTPYRAVGPWGPPVLALLALAAALAVRRSRI
ncbi:apolipoprotein N-acyltransferase [bacterium]|nr:MAG: apolipoprotein N-acyltransferase [bacterium]